MKPEMELYKKLLVDIKNRVYRGQMKVNMSANSELLATYWDIGKMIHLRQQQQGWGKGVIPRLAADLKNELSEIKGFSERNILNMLTFFKVYSDLPFSALPSSQLDNDSISQLSVAKLENADFQLITKTNWAHHIILIQKIDDLPTRFWYLHQIWEQGWTRDTLIAQIKSKLHEIQGALAHNFNKTLPKLTADIARETFKDPYIFDFLTMSTTFSERELELELVKHVEKFLLELGAGFAFVGKQYKIEISDRDFYLDLLFYHLKMRCFVVIDLKKGDFLPEYAGKMNFYCSAVDDLVKHETDKPTIGLILCKGKDKIFAEYALRDLNKPIGVSEYELTQILPDNLKSSLPSIEDIENEFLE